MGKSVPSKIVYYDTALEGEDMKSVCGGHIEQEMQ